MAAREVGMQEPTPDQFNLVVTDMDASVAFYRKLGLTIPGNAVGIMSPIDPQRRTEPDFGTT
jgi:catechol 2,3-dioxygenase-like lactoylglutathione lyase family enzyme